VLPRLPDSRRLLFQTTQTVVFSAVIDNFAVECLYSYNETLSSAIVQAIPRSIDSFH